ncbi:MAG: TetR family transcriptional regulator [Polyangiaceae bacterium]
MSSPRMAKSAPEKSAPEKKAHAPTRARSGRALLAALMRDAGEGEPGSGEKILRAATREAETFGLRRFTVDDVARRLGISRVTIYRYFPKKEQLVEAVLMRELRSFLGAVEAHIEGFDSLEERLVEGVVFALSTLRRHTLLNRLLRTEPETIVPHLTLDAGPVLAAAREFIARYPRAEVAAGRLKITEQQIGVLSEMLARVVLSFVLTPDSAVKLDSPAEIQAFAREYLAPVVRALSRRAR